LSGRAPGSLIRDADAVGGSRLHILNTNKRHSIESHRRMLNAGIAAAFYGEWKLNIDRIRKNDVIFHTTVLGKPVNILTETSLPNWHCTSDYFK
jgi:hypothetical protein